jgi:Flp pilus assembly pilin Flp
MRTRRNKGEGGLLAVILLVVIVAVAYFAVPSFQTWVKDLWSKYGPDTWNDQSVIGLTLTYSDGTTRDFTAPQILSNTVIDPATGLTVTKLTLFIKLKVDYSGVMQSYSGDTQLQINLMDTDTSGLLKTLYFPKVTFSGSSLPSGVWTQIWSADYTIADIESKYTSWVSDKEYVFHAVFSQDFSFNAFFTDGTASSLGLNRLTLNTIDWRFRYRAVTGLTSISVQFLSNPS